MKKILNLKGVQVLSKNELKEVNGSGFGRAYCKGRNRCCFMVNEVEYCEPGRCTRNGFCMFY